MAEETTNEIGYNPTNVDISTDPNKQFNMNLPEFLTNRPGADSVDPDFEIPEVTAALASSAKMLDGQLPDDVVAQIEQLSAERGISRGLGQGQASRNLVARDLGLTSLQVRQQAVQEISALSKPALEAKMQEARLKEEARQWDDRFAAITAETDLKVREQYLASAELVFQAQRLTQELTNTLIIENSRTAIEGVQENITDLFEYFEPTQRALLQVGGISTGGNG